MMFMNLFIECRDRGETADLIRNRYGLARDRKQDVLNDVEAFYREFEYMEYMPVNLPEYD